MPANSEGDVVAPEPCRCGACVSGDAHPNRRLHETVNRLLELVVPAERAHCVATMLEQNALDATKDDLEAITGLPRQDIAAASEQRRSSQVESAVNLFRAAQEIGWDAPSRKTLVSGVKAHMSGKALPPGFSSGMSVKVNGRRVQLRCPDLADSMLIFREIYLEHQYATSPVVSRVFDLGANVGMSAVYFSAMNPEAAVVCVEPMPANLTFLRENLETNGVRASVIAAAVGAERGTMTMNYYPEHFGCSGMQEFDGYQKETIKVDVLPFAEVVSGRDYGLKIDIEGGEHAIVDFPDLIANAAWVVGEVHYRADHALENAPRFERLLQKHFEMQLSPPYAMMQQEQVVRSFRSLKRRP